VTFQALLAAAAEAGFEVEPPLSVWTVSAWHPSARARLTAQCTVTGWGFALLYAGRIYLPTPTDAADLIRILTDTLGVDVRRRASASLNTPEDL
jgi:hypothetical protein